MKWTDTVHRVGAYFTTRSNACQPDSETKSQSETVTATPLWFRANSKKEPVWTFSE